MNISLIPDLLRFKHWFKNLVIFAPLFFTPVIWDEAIFIHVLFAFLSFSVLASLVYLANDWLDRTRDQLHPDKKNRPIASGQVTGTAVLVLGFILSVLLAISLWYLGPAFALILGIYALNNIFYNSSLRFYALLDIASIAFGFVLRVVAGSVAIQMDPSPWLLICVGLLALFMALEKRRDDLHQNMTDAFRPSLQGYNQSFLNACLTFVLSSLLAFYLVYTTDENVMARLGTDQLYITVPFVVFGMLRYLQIALVEKKSGSPVAIFTKDRMLQICVGLWIFSFLIIFLGFI
jgi:decaprenyl-phosphate phosphoribosyltransferase